MVGENPSEPIKYIYSRHGLSRPMDRSCKIPSFGFFRIFWSPFGSFLLSAEIEKFCNPLFWFRPKPFWLNSICEHVIWWGSSSMRKIPTQQARKSPPLFQLFCWINFDFKSWTKATFTLRRPAIANNFTAVNHYSAKIVKGSTKQAFSG